MPTQPDNVVLNKAAIIERSLRRMKEEYGLNPDLDNYTHLDAMILNIERACQAAIDMAQHLAAIHHAGMPQTSADAFLLLEKQGLLSSRVAKAMVKMTGFRNVIIHEYQELELEIVKAVVEKEYIALVDFCKENGTNVII